MKPFIERLLKKMRLYLGNSAKAPALSPSTPLYERSFNRFSLASEVVVTIMNEHSEACSETSELHDISGSGALFVTTFPEKYHIGQQLKLDIFLAGTSAVRACVKTEAEVVRLQPMHFRNESEQDHSQNAVKTGVAVKFSLPFEFQRMDKPGEGNGS